MVYPTIEQYKVAVRAAEHSLSTLNKYEPVMNADGELWCSSGDFAVVFKLKHKQTSKLIALKCFTKFQERRKESYRLISEELNKQNSAYLLSFDYLQNEIYITDSNGDRLGYDVISMEWADGMTLGEYVKTLSEQQNILDLQYLAHNFEDFCAWMIEQTWAHGDLKPDNIIVRDNGMLALVDYDGLFVPSMEGQRAREFGSSIYQHPKRTLNIYDRHIDDFSLLVLLSELRLVATNLECYNNSFSDFSIVARIGDWDDILTSHIYQSMQALALKNSIDWASWAAMLLIIVRSEHHHISDWSILVNKEKGIKFIYSKLIDYPIGNEAAYSDKDKNIVIRCGVINPPNDRVYDFSDGLAMIMRNFAYGFIDQTGEEVIPCIYDDAHSFSFGLAKVKKERKWGYIDRAGKEVIPCKYDEIGYNFSERLVSIKKEGKWGYIDRAGKEVIPCIYDEIGYDFTMGLAKVKKEGKWGYINRAGKEVIPCKYDEIGYKFSEGLATVVKEGKWGYIDRAGKEVIPCIYNHTERFSEGLAAVVKDGKYGFVDKKGNEVILCIYNHAERFSEGLAAVVKDEKWGYIDRMGKEIIPCIYDYTESFSEGLAIVVKYGKYGFVDKKGNEVILCIYSHADSFSEGLATVEKNDKWGYIDKNGKEVISCVYEDIDTEGFSEGLIGVKKFGKWGFIDNTGKNILPYIYDRVYSFSEGFASVCKNGKWGYIDKRGVEYWEGL